MRFQQRHCRFGRDMACVARAQRADEPIIGFLSARSAKESEHRVDAFLKAMAEHGIVEGQIAASLRC